MNKFFLQITSLLLFASTILFAVGCTKSTSTSDTVKTTSTINITGNWQWINSVGGWGGIIQPDKDSVVILKLSKDSTYSFISNNQIKISGNYSTEISKILDSAIVIRFDKAIKVQQLTFYSYKENISYFSKDTLVLYDYLIADGYSHSFKLIP